MYGEIIAEMFRGACIKNLANEDFFRIEDFLFKIGIIEHFNEDRSERVKTFRMMREAFADEEFYGFECSMIAQMLGIFILSRFEGEECAQMLYELGQIAVLCSNGKNAPSLERCREMIQNARH